jgi:excisionase family DNA binding protein
MSDEHATAGYNVSPLEPLLTINAACGVLQVSRNTLYRLVERGELHPSRVGERLRFRPDDVRDYLERGREPVP